MSTPIEEFASACLDELQLSQRFVPYIKNAENAGYPQLAKLLRAMVAGETARKALLRKGMPNHAAETGDFYVCPHCGLIYAHEKPDHCLVDQTPGEQMLVFQ